MSERRVMEIGEFCRMMENDAKLKGSDYLNSRQKMLWERMGAAVAFPFISPVIAVQAIELVACDGVPVFYDLAENNFPTEVVEALKKKGRKACMHKVRSMRNNAEKEEKLLTQHISLAELEKKGDVRVIPPMKKWRKSRMDELPQIADVAMGNLKLVGTRLNTKTQWDQEVVPNRGIDPYEEFFQLMTSGEVMPGVLGAYWLLGDKDVKPEDRYKGEVAYINNASIVTDWRIVWKSIEGILFKRKLIKSGSFLSQNSHKQGKFTTG